mgnify:CR=1 FL=1
MLNRTLNRLFFVCGLLALLAIFQPNSADAQQERDEAYMQNEADSVVVLDLPTTYRFKRHKGFSTPSSFPTSDLTSRPIDSYVFDPAQMRDTVRYALKNEYGYSNIVYPIKNPVTSRFGPRGRRFHYGTDFDLEVGDTLVAVMDGIVRASRVDKNGYGNFIVIAHKGGLETLYAHLSKPMVKVGQKVKAGEIIGLGGNTGRSTGPHLHFEFRFMGEQFDPEYILDTKNFAFKQDYLCLSNRQFTHLDNHPHQHGFGTPDHTRLAANNPAPTRTAANTTRSVSNTSPRNSGGGPGLHIVRKGDTLYSIARRYGTKVDNICKLNGISRNDTLQIGQKIKLL